MIVCEKKQSLAGHWNKCHYSAVSEEWYLWLGGVGGEDYGSMSSWQITCNRRAALES